MNSNDNSKKLKVFYDIAHRAEENLRDLSGYWNILEKQRYFINAIGIYDKMYYELMQLNNSDQPLSKWSIFLVTNCPNGICIQ